MWSNRSICKMGLVVAVAAVLVPAAGVSAQQLIHRFENPSFGGDPFNSAHLLAIANAGRPKETQAPPLTDDELLISQIRARLASNLSSDILSRIENAQPGESGEFIVGDQVVRFTRTATETRVTFTNSRTGAVSETILPVRQAAASPTPPSTPTPSDPIFCRLTGTCTSTGANAGAATPVVGTVVSNSSPEARLGTPPL